MIFRIALAALLAALFFIANRHAFGGFFSADDLDTLTWAPKIGADSFITGFLAPKVLPGNFRPLGHLMYRILYREAGLNFRLWIAVIFLLHGACCGLLFALLRRLKAAEWPALAATLFFALHPALFAAWWKPMYWFDVLCTLFALAALLAWTYERPVLAFIAFWASFKSKELAIALPLAIAAVEYYRHQRIRWLRTLPFFAVSFAYGIQGLLGNSASKEPYKLHFESAALAKTITFYAPWLIVPLLAILIARDRRWWIAVALTLSVTPLLFLPGRLFAVYLYLPLTGAAIALALVFERLPKLITGAALALWLTFSYAQLRNFRHEELATAQKHRSYVDTLVAAHFKEPLYLLDGQPRELYSWGIEGALRLSGAPENTSARRIEIVDHWHDTLKPGTPILSWDEDAGALRLSTFDPTRPLTPYLQLADPNSIWQLERGARDLHGAARPLQQSNLVRLSVPAGAHEFRLAWRGHAAEKPCEITVLIDGEWLGTFPFTENRDYETFWPVNRKLPPQVTITIHVLRDFAADLIALGFR